jgi:DNA-binding MarR family transcriptional regulator
MPGDAPTPPHDDATLDAATNASVLPDTPGAAADADRFEQIQLAIGVVARRARDTQLLESLGARVGRPLEGPSYSTLSRLALAEECTVTELARLLGLELSTVSRRVKALEAEGLVARTTSPTDRRTSQLRLTTEGRELFEAMSSAWRDVLVEVLEDWDPFSIEVFAELFSRFATALDHHDATPAGPRPEGTEPAPSTRPTGRVPTR